MPRGLPAGREPGSRPARVARPHASGRRPAASPSVPGGTPGVAARALALQALAGNRAVGAWLARDAALQAAPDGVVQRVTTVEEARRGAPWLPARPTGSPGWNERHQVLVAFNGLLRRLGNFHQFAR